MDEVSASDERFREILSRCFDIYGISAEACPPDMLKHIRSMNESTMLMLSSFHEVEPSAMPWVCASMEACVRFVREQVGLADGPSMLGADPYKWRVEIATALGLSFPAGWVPGVEEIVRRARECSGIAAGATPTSPAPTGPAHPPGCGCDEPGPCRAGS